MKIPKALPRCLALIAAALWAVSAVSLLGQCSDASAAVPSFMVTLPDGQVIEARCAMYDPDAKAFAFSPCDAVFTDSFE